MAFPPVVQHNIDGFSNQMMPHVTDCDYNKHLLYMDLRGKDTNFGKKSLRDGTEYWVQVDWDPVNDADYEFTVMIESQPRNAPRAAIYSDEPIPDKHDDQTKDSLWKAVKTAVDLFDKMPGNLCTTCNRKLAWADTTTCPTCSFAAVRRDVPGQPGIGRPTRNWSSRVMPQAR